MASSSSPHLRRRLIAVGILALWAAPGAGALAVGLHLTVGHHHDAGHHGAHHHGDDHRASALELVLAAVHGHHHDLEAMPDHEHPAAFAAGGPGAQPSASAADLPPDDATRCLSGHEVETPSPARPGPPASLYAAHCSLLL